jgi:hypothetical protein
MAEKLLLQAGCTSEVKIEKRFPNRRLVGGKFILHSNAIVLYEETIEEQCRLLFGDTSYLGPYMMIVLAHEIGHAMDRDLQALSAALEQQEDEEYRREISLKIEENAWNFSKMLIPYEYQGLFEKIKRESLASYQRQTALAAN